MKKLWNKIHINYLTYVVLLLSLIGGYVKYVVIILAILFVHEAGHIIAIKFLNKKIQSITILPFGGIIKLNGHVSDSIIEELLISIAGIASQTIFGLILNFFKDFHCYSIVTYYNKLLITFNLLPICPLDGYNIIKCLLELFVPYEKSLHISILFSLIILSGIVLIKSNLIRDNLLLISFILYRILLDYKNIKYQVNKFYLERILYTFNYKLKKIKTIKNMFRNKVHTIDGIKEREYLLKYKYSRK